MQTKRGWTGPRLAALTMTLALAGVHSASASSTPVARSPVLMSYRTSGTIDTTQGVSGPTDIVAINFRSVEEASFESPSSNLSLGEFVVAALPQGVVTTYEDTKFMITYFADKINGEDPGLNEGPITFTGVLNGTVSGPNQSNVVATFDPITTEEFRTGDYLNTISILSPMVSLVPSSTNGGRTTAQARLSTTLAPLPPPIPEPATLTIFVAAIAGLGLRRRLRAKAA